MRIAELLGKSVVDSDGVFVGRVDDVQLDRFDADQRKPLTVHGLVIGNGGMAVRLGYFRHGVKGPWLLKSLAGLVERKRARFVPWPDVADWREDNVVLRIERTQLQSVSAPE